MGNINAVNNNITAAAREALIAAYAEKARREIVYGSSEFSGFYARSAAHYALRYR